MLREGLAATDVLAQRRGVFGAAERVRAGKARKVQRRVGGLTMQTRFPWA